MNLYTTLGYVAIALVVGISIGLLIAAYTFKRYDEWDAAARQNRADAYKQRERALDEPDLFDDQGRAHVEGLKDGTMLSGPRAAFYRGHGGFLYPVAPTSEFDGPGQHASSAPLFLQRPGV